MKDAELNAVLQTVAEERLKALVAAVKDSARQTPAGLVPTDIADGEDLWSGFAVLCAGEDLPYLDEYAAIVRTLIEGVVEQVPSLELAIVASHTWLLGSEDGAGDWPETDFPSVGAMRRCVVNVLWHLVCRSADEDGTRIQEEIEERVEWISETWPSHGPVLAWCPPDADRCAASIPITPEDLQNGLTAGRYRERLAARIIWMIEVEENPSSAIRELSDELARAGVWDQCADGSEKPVWASVMMMLDDNPLWPDYLNTRIQLPDGECWAIENDPEAVSSIRTTWLGEWISRTM